MQNLIVTLLTHDANRAQCLAILECTDDANRAHAQARLNVLDTIQKEAQKVIYMESPAGMVDSWEIREWYFEKYGHGNLHHIDFQAISDGKKQEWYAYANQVVETNL
jgi:hypothetical protein